MPPKTPENFSSIRKVYVLEKFRHKITETRHFVHHLRPDNDVGEIPNAFAYERNSCVSGGATNAAYFFYETTWAYLSFKKNLDSIGCLTAEINSLNVDHMAQKEGA